MRFINDAQRRAAFANMFAKGSNVKKIRMDNVVDKAERPDESYQFADYLLDVRRRIKERHKAGEITDEERDRQLALVRSRLHEPDSLIRQAVAYSPKSEQKTEEDELRDSLRSVGERVLLKQQEEAKKKDHQQRAKDDVKRHREVQEEFRARSAEAKLEQLREMPKVERDIQKARLVYPALGYASRYGLRGAGDVAKAGYHLPGRIMAPPMRGVKRVLTAPARALGSAASGVKGTVGFAGQEAASMLHDFSSAIASSIPPLSQELGRGISRAARSGPGVTREMGDPFLKEWYTQARQIKPIGGVAPPSGVQRFDPSTWSGGRLL